MQTHIAKTLEDVKSVIEFMEDKKWKHARRFLTAAPADPFADHLRWLEDDGRPVACVQVFVHQYPIGCAHVGTCLPEYPFVPSELRGRGCFKQLMAGLFEWMREAGYPLAYDHGRKGLYTSAVGYAPCFHHCMVLIRVKDAINVRAHGKVEEPTEADVATFDDLFRRPFPLGRGLQCRDERWRPDPRCVRLLHDPANRPVQGFVVLGQVLVGRKASGEGFATFKPPETGEVLTLTDSWASDISAAAALLRSVADEAQDAGFECIRLNCRRDDALARIAVLAGGELRWCAAQERSYSEEGEDVDAFYLADFPLAIRQLLPELNVRWKRFKGEAPSAVRLSIEDDEATLGLGHDVTIRESAAADIPRVRLPRKAMTRAIMGYATPTELCLLHEGCDIPEACRAVLDALFTAREPHLIHERYTFASINELGLLP